MNINKKQRRNRAITTYIASGAVLVLLFAYGLVAHGADLWPFNNDGNVTDTTLPPVNTVNYSPPTDEEVQASQSGKQSIADSNSKSDEPLKNDISVGVSYAGITESRKDRVEIRAFTPSVVEGDGTCTAKLTSGSNVVLETSEAFVDSTTSQCRPIYIATSRFATNGKWTLVVSYKSVSGTGSSEKIEVNI